MINKRRLFFRLIAVLLLVVIAVAMFIVGRGHTVYVDNKTIEANGETYKAFNRVNVFVNGERGVGLFEGPAEFLGFGDGETLVGDDRDRSGFLDRFGDLGDGFLFGEKNLLVHGMYLLSVYM